MPKISNRGIQMPSSPIRKLVPFSEQAKSEGAHVYHLNIGQPDIKTPEIALAAVKNNNISILAYSRSEGSDQYRSKLADYYKVNQIEVEANDIIVTTGGSEALQFILGSIMDQEDEIIIPEPFYANYNGFSTAQGINVIPVVSKIENNFALPPISEFEKLITAKTKAVLICNPGNPTGYLYSKEEINQLEQLVIKHDLFLISDEVYREFCYDGYTHNSIMTKQSLRDHAIMIDSVSKRYSMCGARIGCLVTKNKNVYNTALKFAQARLSPPTYAQIASEAALSTPDSYFQKVINEYSNRRNILIEELQKIDGVKVATPRGAFYCIVELPITNADDLTMYLLESAKVAVVTGNAFGSPNCVRISYASSIKSLQIAVRRISGSLSRLQ